MNIDLPFGGKVVICSGDFGQLSPVTYMPGRASALAVSIKEHESFKCFERLLLRKSERHVDDPGFTGFTDALADGHGKDGYFNIAVPKKKIIFGHLRRVMWEFGSGYCLDIQTKTRQ